MKETDTKTETKTTVLEVDELQQLLGIKGWIGRRVASAAYRLLELDEVNRVHHKFHDSTGPEFSAHVLEEVGIRYEIAPEQLDRIPWEGGFITVSNHHYGSLDGMILSAVVGSRRPDYKILTTFFLSLIPSLKDSFIGVDNFSAGGAKSISGIRAALGHIGEQHPLGLFPAGEVGTWQKGKNKSSVTDEKIVEDIPWADNIIKLIKKSGFPVIPIYFEGGNSKSFHVLGKIHPRLRTARLIHEVFNKPGQVIRVRIGQPIAVADIAAMDIPTLGKFLRSRTYALEGQLQTPAPPSEQTVATPVAEPVPADEVRAEMAKLEQYILFENGDYRGYLIPAPEAPVVMRELYRLREETFRAIGEGTGLALDTDEYDAYYKQMILWHVPNQEIVGAYRLGFGPEIMEKHGGRSGFYSDSLVRYGDKAAPLLSRSMELGRSFIVQKYQREVQPLRLLLTGLAVSVLKHPDLEYYSGPVSISNDIPHFYKSLIVDYVTKNYPMPDAARIAQPSHPFVPDFLAVNPDDLRIAPGNIDALDRTLLALSDGKYRLPVLVRKYFSCGARLVCFNVDPLFCDSLDGLIFLKYSDFPKNTTRAVLRGLPDELQDAVWMRFYGEPRP
jgi:putative hemolysin